MYNNDHFSVVDTCSGAFFRHASDSTNQSELAFILLPRTSSSRALGCVPAQHTVGNKAELDILMMESYQKLSMKTKRGKGKISSQLGSYSCPGLKPNRGGRGIIECHYNLEQVLNCSENTPSYMMQLNNLTKRAERLLDEYLPADDLRAFVRAKKITQFPTLTGSLGIYAAAAMSVDYCSAAHTDLDFFHTVLSVRSVDQSKEERLPFESNYASNPEPAYHFIFPTIGVAVALRPGDHLIFNPNIPHACSVKLKSYANHRTYLCAVYLKLGVVGLNDNKLRLSRLQEEIADIGFE